MSLVLLLQNCIEMSEDITLVPKIPRQNQIQDTNETLDLCNTNKVNAEDLATHKSSYQ